MSVCVCYRASCYMYIPVLYVENKVAIRLFVVDTHCVDFVENVLFKTFGDIFRPSSLLSSSHSKETVAASFQED